MNKSLHEIDLISVHAELVIIIQINLCPKRKNTLSKTNLSYLRLSPELFDELGNLISKFPSLESQEKKQKKKTSNELVR